MREVTKERIIPERRFTSVVYIAEDGREFDDKVACECYEMRLEINKHPVIATRISYVELPFSGDDVTLYKIRSKEDYDYFRKYVTPCSRMIDDEFCVCGPGWYIFQAFSGGDWDDECCLLNYDAYCKRIKQKIADFEQEINKKISSRESEGQ